MLASRRVETASCREGVSAALDTSLRSKLTVAFAVFVITAATFSAALTTPFSIYDDTQYVTANPNVADGVLKLSTWKYALTGYCAGNWHPVTMLSHATDVSLYGLTAGGHHLTSVILHAATAALFALFLLRAGASPVWALLGATAWAVHPLRVESVAWISERKDVLSGLFLMLTLHAWWTWQRTRRRAHLALTLLCTALGMMAKPMLVTLPALLVLVTVWPMLARPVDRRAVWRLCVDVLPFAGASVALSVVTHLAQGSPLKTTGVSWLLRLQNTPVAYSRYIAKTIWPRDLIAPYSYPIDGWSSLRIGASCLVVGGFFVLAVVAWRRAWPSIYVAVLWFFGALVPVIGLVMVGIASLADRYTYIPSLMPVAAIVTALSRSRRQQLWQVPAAVVCFALGAQTQVQIGYWRSSATMFLHAASVEQGLSYAWASVSVARFAEHELMLARWAADNAVASPPPRAENFETLSMIAMAQGEPRHAIVALLTALSMEPDNGNYHARLALALLRTREYAPAASEIRRALLDDTVNDARLIDIAQEFAALDDHQHASDLLRRVPTDFLTATTATFAVRTHCRAGHRDVAEQLVAAVPVARGALFLCDSATAL